MNRQLAMSASIFFTKLVLRITWDNLFEGVLLTIKLNKVDYKEQCYILLKYIQCHGKDL